MAFVIKTWGDRLAEFPNRRRLEPTGIENTYDVVRAEGNVAAEGDKFDAATMNDLEQRIAAGFSDTVQGATVDGEVVPKNDGVLDFPMPTAKQTGALPHNPSVIVDPDNMPDGIYYYSGHLEIPANTTGDGEIIQISHDQSFIIQIAYGFHLSGMAVRVKESGTWLAWSKISANKADYASGSVDIGSLGLRNIQASNTQASSYLGLGAINVVI